MFVICRDGHLGFWWDGEKKIFVESDSAIFPSRSECLEYLEGIHGKDKAVDIIVSLKKGNGINISF